MTTKDWLFTVLAIVIGGIISAIVISKTQARWQQ